jgi:hypothetical protein
MVYGNTIDNVGRKAQVDLERRGNLSRVLKTKRSIGIVPLSNIWLKMISPHLLPQEGPQEPPN